MPRVLVQGHHAPLQTCQTHNRQQQQAPEVHTIRPLHSGSLHFHRRGLVSSSSSRVVAGWREAGPTWHCDVIHPLVWVWAKLAEGSEFTA
jgi:hypothetical protein